MTLVRHSQADGWIGAERHPARTLLEAIQEDPSLAALGGGANAEALAVILEDFVALRSEFEVTDTSIRKFHSGLASESFICYPNICMGSILNVAC